MKNYTFLILVFLISVALTFSQTPTTVSMNPAMNNAAAFGTQGTIATSVATFYTHWDATYLYIGWSGGRTNYSSDMYYVAIDTDPNGVSGSSVGIEGVNFTFIGSPTLPDYYVVYENNDSFYGGPVTEGNAFELYNGTSGSWVFNSRTGGDDGISSQVDFQDANGEVRLRIPWTSLGFTRGHDKPIGLVYWTNNPSGNYMWSRFPDSNPVVGPTPKSLSLQIIFNSSGDGIDPSNSFYENSYLSKTIYSSSSSGNWESSGTWQYGGVPQTGGTITVNDHSLTLNSSPSINQLTIDELGTVIVAKENNLNISGNLEVQDNSSTNFGLLELNSGPDVASGPQKYSSLIVGGFSNGFVTYKRWANADANGNSNNNGRDLVSPPVSGQQFNDFYTINGTNIASGSSNELFGPFDNSSGAYVEYASTATNTLDPGKGYRTATTGTSGAALAFEGTVNVGQVDVSISDYGDTNFGRWNLIGNPFPSYVSFIDFYNANKAEFDTGIFQSIYGYDANPAGTGGIWTIWNNLNTTDLIAPGQAFFVKCKAIDGVGGTTTVSFTASTRMTGTTEDFITDNRQAESPAMAFSKIDLNSSNANSQTDIYFVEGTTRGIDPGYDAGAFGGSAGDFSIYTNLVEDNTGDPLAIQALPYEDMNDIVVPLGLNVDQGVQISIGIHNSSTIPQNINVYLEDNVANTWTLLNTGDYVFTPSTTLSGTGRFFVHFTTSTLSTEDTIFSGLQIYADNSSRSVVIKGELNSGAHVLIYDLQGRQMIKRELNSSVNINLINVNNLSTGLYIVELSDFNKIRTQKVIIK